MLLSQITAYLPRPVVIFVAAFSFLFFFFSMIANHYNYCESGPTKRQKSAEGARQRNINRNLNPLLSADIGDRLALEARAVISTWGEATLLCEECCYPLVFVTYQGDSACGRGSDKLSAGWQSTVRGNTQVCKMGISNLLHTKMHRVYNLGQFWSFIANCLAVKTFFLCSHCLFWRTWSQLCFPARTLTVILIVLVNLETSSCRLPSYPSGLYSAVMMWSRSTGGCVMEIWGGHAAIVLKWEHSSLCATITWFHSNRTR